MHLIYLFDEISGVSYASNYYMITFDGDQLHRENYNWKPEILIRSFEQVCVGIIATEIFASDPHTIESKQVFIHINITYLAVNRTDRIICQVGWKEKIYFS